MKVKQTVIGFMASLVVSLGIVGVVTVSPALAADQTSCGETKTSIIGGDICQGVDNKSGKIEDNAIWKLLVATLNIMTAGIGILAVGGIVYGSVLYASAGDRADQTKKAIEIIRNVVIGLLAYGLMYIGLNFLIPGGIFY